MSPAAAISEVARKYLRVHLTASLGPVITARCLEMLGGIDALLGAPAEQLRRVDGVGSARAEQICRDREKVDVDAEIEAASRLGAHILCLEDEGYPAALRQIPDPPVCLYVRGRLEPRDAFCVAVVGTRNPTHYGAEQARRFGYLLAQAGCAVVSGLARGIDALAHAGALEAGGRTIGVLGHGLGHVFPPEHADLFEKVAAHGALITEFPIDTRPDRGTFPVRNRIIAGLSLGTLVVEGGRQSGSLITARLAGEYDREVFAIPGRIDHARAEGPNRLIRDQHAKLVTCLEDILSELPPVEALASAVRETAERIEHISPAEETNGVDDLEARILEALGFEEVHVDDLIGRCGGSASEVLPALTLLQLKARVRRLPGDRFVRVRGRSGG